MRISYQVLVLGTICAGTRIETRADRFLDLLIGIFPIFIEIYSESTLLGRFLSVFGLLYTRAHQKKKKENLIAEK